MRKKIKIAIVTAFSSVSLFSAAAYADYGKEYLFTGGLRATDVKKIKYVISGGSSSYQKNVMKAGVEAWNGISSKVKVTEGSSGAKVSVILKNSDKNNLYGIMMPFSNGARDYDLDEIWDNIDVIGYENTLSKIGLSEQRGVFTHEMGHALSLAHNDSDSDLIMHPYALTTDVQTDDEKNLKLKWGK
ncbi:matrixin family metalloprotease (plasmid) [Brevibacillus halotolerans]|nr:matrixin family metalloprotease [Brevibacillus halotolerans]